MTELKYTIPLPHRMLFPNTCKNWKAKMKYKKEARAFGRSIAHPAHLLKSNSELFLRCSFVFKDKRPRDLDNALSSLKSVLDGLFEGLNLNDRQIKTIEITKAPFTCDPPHVLLTIKELNQYLENP